MAIGGIRSGLGFSDFTSTTAKQMQGGARAAENASVAENFQQLREGAPDYGRQGQEMIAAESLKRQARVAAEATVEQAKELAAGRVEAAEITGKQKADEAKSAAKSAVPNALISTAIPLLASVALSDEKTKNNIEHIQDALAVLRELRPVTFYYNEEYSSTPERLHHGFIAQEYVKHMPDATYYDESADAMCIDTVELIALLVRSVQQLETKVARMEAQNALTGVKS